MIQKLLQFINLNSGEENKEYVLENVRSNTSFRGSNIWILACAIVIASIGLNVNSTAVIIGAMLISPLMSPIVGAGFSLGTFDFTLLKKSLKNLIIATAVSLIVSTLYFYVSPFKETQSELLARTTPTIYDVLIAFFGGLVGAIAITRKEKGNPIPGVAIATALMPPLCTAGYGLAIGNLSFFFGALFLYTINCVFICIATFLIVKFLRYPSVNYVNKNFEKKIKYSIYLLVIVMIVPSTFFAYQLVQEKKYLLKVDNFLENSFYNNGYTLIYKNINSKSNPKKVTLAFLTKKFSQTELIKINNNKKLYGLQDTEIIIKQDTVDIKKKILNEINIGKSKLNQKDIIIENLENIIKNNTFDNEKILNEVKILFPEITTLSIANHEYHQNTDSLKVIPIMIYKSTNELNLEAKSKLKLWLSKRLNKENLQILSAN